MITDKLINSDLYCIDNQNLLKAFDYLKNTDLLNLENGKHIIDGDNIFVIIQDYQTKQKADSKWEAHRIYTDIQVVITGQEMLGYLDIKQFCPETDYDTDKDIIFGGGTGDFISACSGDFVIFTPKDAHMPSICIDNPSYVKKAVVKIKL